MHIILTLFWIGLLISVALIVFNLVLSFGMVVIGGVAVGISWLFNKVRGK